MKRVFFVAFWIISLSIFGQTANRPTRAAQTQETETESVGQVLTLFYNNLHSIEKHNEAKALVLALIEKCPDNPLLYELWCAIEWSSISLELEMKFDERRDILGIAPYRKRAERYHEMVAQGLQLADQALARANGNGEQRRKWLFAKGALYYADAKFIAKFEDGLAGLKRADLAGAAGIREFAKILAEDKNFSAPYLYLGGTRYQISSQGLAGRIAVRMMSYSFAKINNLCEGDVVNKSESIQWLEKAYAYGAPEPWLKKNWIESALLLAGVGGAYEKFRVEKGFSLSDEKRYIREKEFPILLWLIEQFPQNKKLQQKRTLLELRLGWKN